MSAGRRGLILSVIFLGMALWLCPSQRAHAQFRKQPVKQPMPPPQPRWQFNNNNGNSEHHSIWKRDLTPDEIREMLAKFGTDNGKGDDPLLDLLRRIVQDKNSKATPEQIDEAARRLLADKEFRDRMMDLAQKHKNQFPNKGNGGPPPNLTKEDIAKLLQLKPNGDDDPFKVRPKELDPRQLPPFDPRNPNFDPKRFPKIDPLNPPQFDPDTKFPIDPNTREPFDPRNGQPIDPKNPPRIDPPPPNPDQPPQVNPQPNPPVRPMPPPNPDANRKFDPQNPLGTPRESPDKVAKTKAVEAATALWEKNVGPIDESPGVKQAILELVNDSDAMDALTDGKGNNIFDALDKDTGNGEKFGDWFSDGDSKWEWPKFDFGWGRGRGDDLDFGSHRERDTSWSHDSPRTRGSSSMDSMGSFSVGSMQVPVLLLLLILAAIVAAVVWWKWGSLLQRRQAVGVSEASGGWPLDPREINTREDVVKAFEYLSVLICGAGAKTWTHSTIADELGALAVSEPETALKLARLYELARYAPLDEPLTRAELLEARRLVCELAGIDEI